MSDTPQPPEDTAEVPTAPVPPEAPTANPDPTLEPALEPALEHSPAPESALESGPDAEAEADAAATPAADPDAAAIAVAVAVAPAAPAAPRIPELSPAQCGARLAALFPALFGQRDAQPLKLRIQADIQQRAPGVFTRKTLSAFLHRYTTTNGYLQALGRATQRVDLDGAPAGEIAAEHREAATTELVRRKGLMEARRVADMAARRQADATAQAARQAENPSAAAPADRDVDEASRAGHARQAGPREHAPRRQAHPAGRDERTGRPERPERTGRPGITEHPGSTEHRERSESAGRSESAARPSVDVQAQPPREAEQPGRRERAALLRAYESSTLAPANFCALKGLSQADLDTQLAQARQEASERGPAPVPPGSGGPSFRPPGDRPANAPDRRPRRPRPGP